MGSEDVSGSPRHVLCFGELLLRLAAPHGEALLEGAGWLHLSGIIPALGPEMAEIGLAAIAAARAAGVRVSFDGNFRGSLWARWCPDPGPILAQYIAGADLLFGDHRDLSLVLEREFAGKPDARQHDAALA